MLWGYGLPDDSQTTDGKYQMIPFHYYLNPQTMEPSDCGEGSMSNATSARFTGVHFVNTIDSCLKKSYVHGMGVLKYFIQYKHYLFTSIIHTDTEDKHSNRIIVWDMKTDKAIFALKQDHDIGIVDLLIFDDKNMEIIGAVSYPGKIFRWTVPALFNN